MLKLKQKGWKRGPSI